MNQHDETRKILNLIRENKRKPLLSKSLLSEQEQKGELDPTELKEEEKKFRDTVTPRVKFNRFKLYPEAQNVEFSGEFTDNRVEWFFSLDDTQGVYVTTDMLQLREDTMKLLQKLIGYYKTWSEEWANRIAEEYENLEADEENKEEGPESLESPDFGEEGEGESIPNPTEENA
tara:strand:+ start:9444 stop:9962 length:519 start_codon:yes stop_codon:yes gene_type:complete